MSVFQTSVLRFVEYMGGIPLRPHTSSFRCQTTKGLNPSPNGKISKGSSHNHYLVFFAIISCLPFAQGHNYDQWHLTIHNFFAKKNTWFKCSKTLILVTTLVDETGNFVSYGAWGKKEHHKLQYFSLITSWRYRWHKDI